MEAIAICADGIEDIAALEIQERIHAITEKKEGGVLLTPKKLEDLFLLCYKAQSLDRIFLLLTQTTVAGDPIKNMEQACREINLKEWFPKESTFRVTCIKRNTELFSEKIEADIGEIIINQAGKPKVNLENPDITFLVYINKNQAYLGIDISHKDLNKREYKIFPSSRSLKGSTAYSLLRIAEYKKTETLLDPFSNSGEIPIEAALFTTNFPVNYYAKNTWTGEVRPEIDQKTIQKVFETEDKKITKPKKPLVHCFDATMPNITAAKKNAKIAGVNKIITFSRMDLDWLDTRLEKGSIDKIVTQAPENSTRTNKKDIEKLYKELFHQADFVLKKAGTITVLQRKPHLLKAIAKQQKFEIKEERTMFAGKEPMQVIVFHRN